MKTFYTYLWLREDGTPYYVGKGSGERAYRKSGPARDRVLVQPHPSEKDAFAAETFLITYYGRADLGTGCLRNLSEGGAGASGAKHSEKSRQARSLMMQGHKRNVGKKRPDVSARMRLRKGVPQPHLKGNINALGKHWKLSAEAKQKMSEASKIRTRTATGFFAKKEVA